MAGNEADSENSCKKMALLNGNGLEMLSKMSSMERECMIEKQRTAILMSCSEMLRRDGTSRYGKEAFRTLFHNEVKTIDKIIFIKFDKT